MGEDVLDRAGFAPIGLGGCPFTVGRQGEHAAEQAALRAAHQQNLALMLEPVGDPFAARPGRLARLHRIKRRIGLAESPAIFVDRAASAIRSARRADGLAKLHHRLDELAGAAGGGQAVGQLDDAPAGLWQRLLHRKQPGDDALDIGVDRHRTPVEGDRGDRRGGIGADTRQAPQLCFHVGETSLMFGRYQPGAGKQVAGAGIIAKPSPGGHDLGIGRTGQRLNGRPAPHEGFEIGTGMGDGRLLEHDLGQPHPIGVRFQAGFSPPRQRPLIHSIPTQKRLGGIDGHGEPMPCLPHSGK